MTPSRPRSAYARPTVLAASPRRSASRRTVGRRSPGWSVPSATARRTRRANWTYAGAGSSGSSCRIDSAGSIDTPNASYASAVLPGLSVPLIDMHTHLMPERLFQAVRAYFRAHLWQPRYDAPTQDLVQTLIEAGVDRFVFMPYAHRANMARSLNHWVANVQTTFTPHAIGFGTFHPDDDEALPGIADEAFDQLKLRGAKLHPQVGGFAVDDPRLNPLYERAIERGAVLL